MERDTHDAIVRTIKGLTIDAVEAAQSGHPGLPMGMADAATVLWTRFLRHDPARPEWPNRDRFVLSAGHGSMLLYSLLHLTGYDLALDDLKRFRKLGSPTAGHPEHGDAPGIETTTGPLGQGFANGIGMAIGERYAACRWNGERHRVLDHHVYAIVSDGDLMEGVASEAASLAGHLGLGKLVYLYDDNQVTIDGPTDLAFSAEDVGRRFEAYGWHVQKVDGHDPEAVAAAIEAGRSETERPSLIVCRTVIGHGSPSWEGTSNIHSDPVGPEEVRRIKERVGLPPEESFHVPDAVRAFFAKDRERLAGLTAAWDDTFAAWREDDMARADDWDRAWGGDAPIEAIRGDLADYAPGGKDATRSVSGQVIQVVARHVPGLIGGSADLTPSNKTEIKGGGIQSRTEPGGRNIAYGVREHAMGAVMNGLSLYGPLRPYGGTFMTFSDYMRPAIRLAALMKQPVAYVFTHDSIFLGEDGPTHQAVEHVMALRTIPNLDVDRPADGRETAAAWLAAIARKSGPTALALTRQKVPFLAETSIDGALRGGYVALDAGGDDAAGTGSAAVPELILIGTGSELQLCVGAARVLAAEDGVRVRVVSLPCWERFEAQDASYRDSVLPSAATLRLSVEAGVTLGWERYTLGQGRAIGHDEFGRSAPWEDLARRFGFTVERVVAAARQLLS